MIKILEKIEGFVFYALLFLLPLFTFSFFANPYTISKLALLIGALGILVISKSLKVALSGKLDYSVAKFDFPIFLLGLGYICSTWFTSPNKMDALLLPGTTTLYIGGILLYFLTNQYHSPSQKRSISSVLLYSGALISLLTLCARTGLLSQIDFLPTFIKSNYFTPLASYLQNVIFLTVLIPLSLDVVLSEKGVIKKILQSISLLLVVIVVGLSIYEILPGQPNATIFPDLKTSWVISIDTLKDSPLLGIGPGNYLTAFNRFRPISFNSSPLWAVKFSTASNTYLTMLTEVGLLGLAGLLLLGFSIYKFIQKDIREKKLVGWGFIGSANLISLILLVILLFFFPAGIDATILLFLLLALVARQEKVRINLTLQTSNTAEGFPTERIAARWPALLFFVVCLVIVITVFSKGTRYLSGEYTFRNSLVKLSQNKGVDAYEEMKKALIINPQVDRYHASYAQVNLALANAVAKKAEAAEGKLTDEERTTISQLIQQAIREGKSAIALNPYRANSWEALGRTYRAIAPLAKGADDFAIQSFSQAILLDPLNPTTRIELGGMYFAKKDYLNAVAQFELATRLKNDYANAHYNLSIALKEAGNINRAIGEMSNVLALVAPNSKDYEAARKALDDLEAKKKELDAANTDNLTSPTNSEQILTPPLDLNDDLEPPTEAVTPTPTSSQISVTPQITPTPIQ